MSFVDVVVCGALRCAVVLQRQLRDYFRYLIDPV